MSNALLLRRRALLASVVAAGGGGNLGYRGGAVLTYAGGNFTGTYPAGIVAGDVIYACFLQDAGTTTGTGYTADASGNTPTNSFPCTVLRKVAAGTEGGTAATFASGASIGEGVLIVISGANASPVDATTTVATGTTAAINFPSITTAHANSMHLAVACNFNALATAPGGYSTRQTSATWVASFSKIIAAIGAVTGVAGGNGGEWVAFSIAVRTS